MLATLAKALVAREKYEGKEEVISIVDEENEEIQKSITINS